MESEQLDSYSFPAKTGKSAVLQKQVNSSLMSTKEAFLHALNLPHVKETTSSSTLRTWRSRAAKELISLDFMVEFLSANGYQLKQTMTWTAPGALKVHLNDGDTPIARNREDNDIKAEICRELNLVRKELYSELLIKWTEWAVAESTSSFPDAKQKITPLSFNRMVSGRYISNENVLFALKVLKEGKRLLHEYNEQIRKELESL